MLGFAWCYIDATGVACHGLKNQFYTRTENIRFKSCWELDFLMHGKTPNSSKILKNVFAMRSEKKKKSLKPEVNNQVDLNNERIAIPFCRGSKVIGMEDLMAHFSAGCHTPSY